MNSVPFHRHYIEAKAVVDSDFYNATNLMMLHILDLRELRAILQGKIDEINDKIKSYELVIQEKDKK